jgi:hypothetical protein
MEKYIVIKPQFVSGDFCLTISDKIPVGKLKNYYLGEEGGEYFPFFYPHIKKIDGNYKLLFSEIDTISNDNILFDLATWIEDTHFFIYYQNMRCTFDTLNITEVIIENGILNYKEDFIKEIIPDSIFLNLDSGGVQQFFFLEQELLFAKKELWVNNEVIRNLLIADYYSSIEICLKEFADEKYTNNTLTYYGSAFNQNKSLERLAKMGYIFTDNDLIKKLLEIQFQQRDALLAYLKKKVGPIKEKIQFNVLDEMEKELSVNFPLTFKRIYTEIGNSGFGPYFGFLPLNNKKNSIKNLSMLLRERYKFPDYLMPFAYLGKNTYACINTSSAAFPIINFYRKPCKPVKNWYDVYEQTTDSFEEWLDNWINEIFPEKYQPRHCH